MQAAIRAREAGSTRFCMGAAWRGPSQVGERQWDRVLTMVKQIRCERGTKTRPDSNSPGSVLAPALLPFLLLLTPLPPSNTKCRGLGMEVCTTLGMLTPQQAKELREAGLTAYNHNLDTSPEYYGKVTTSRKYEDRLETLENVREAGISVCAGGIIGLGEGEMDRVGLIHQLATLPAHPESVPINRLVAVQGTPFEVRGAAVGRRRDERKELRSRLSSMRPPFLPSLCLPLLCLLSDVFVPPTGPQGSLRPGAGPVHRHCPRCHAPHRGAPLGRAPEPDHGGPGARLHGRGQQHF
jgi:hypothetical protein